jgi:predicted ATPase
MADRTGERWFGAELYRHRGQWLAKCCQAERADMEACFHRAIALSQRQRAKSWELRAATSLAHFLRDQGKRAEARRLLAQVYGCFEEGFDTLDLQEARAFLDDM